MMLGVMSDACFACPNLENLADKAGDFGFMSLDLKGIPKSPWAMAIGSILCTWS